MLPPYFSPLPRSGPLVFHSRNATVHAALRTVFENHCSTSNSTPTRYDVTALAIIKPKKHQRLADPLLQSGVVTHNNRVECAIKSIRKSIWQNR